MKDKSPPLWTYEGNAVNISEWLDGWFENIEASPADMLTWLWFYGVADPGSDWTRNRELLEWIEASQIHPHAWEGLKRLLRELRKGDHHQPPARTVADFGPGCRRRHTRTAKEEQGSRWPSTEVARCEDCNSGRGAETR